MSDLLETNSEASFSLDHLKESTITLFSQAEKIIQIYSQGLDPRILNNRDIERQLILFIKKSRYCKVQILINSECLLKGIDHRIVSLAQRFTSQIEIKLIMKDYHDNYFGFYITDHRSMLYRKNIERYEAEKLQMPSLKIKEQSKLFNSIWQSANPASFLRALHI